MPLIGMAAYRRPVMPLSVLGPPEDVCAIALFVTRIRARRARALAPPRSPVLLR